jgi:hypothetical protein
MQAWRIPDRKEKIQEFIIADWQPKLTVVERIVVSVYPQDPVP